MNVEIPAISITTAKILTRDVLPKLTGYLDASDVVECYAVTRMAKLKTPPLPAPRELPSKSPSSSPTSAPTKSGQSIYDSIDDSISNATSNEYNVSHFDDENRALSRNDYRTVQVEGASGKLLARFLDIK